MLPALRMASTASFMGIKTVVLKAENPPLALMAMDRAAIVTLSGNSPMATKSKSPNQKSRDEILPPNWSNRGCNAASLS